MKKVTYSIFINASREKVWESLTGQDTYSEWTKAFNPTSRFSGSWEQGEEIRFMGTENGVEGGMISRIAENRMPEYLSIEHRGMMVNGVDDFDSENVKKWLPAFENYTLTEKDGGTEFVVDMDTADEYEAYMNETYPKALELLKEISER